MNVLRLRTLPYRHMDRTGRIEQVMSHFVNLILALIISTENVLGELSGSDVSLYMVWYCNLLPDARIPPSLS